MKTRKDRTTTLSDAGRQRAAERERQRAEALRANLHRRKAQGRERSREQAEARSLELEEARSGDRATERYTSPADDLSDGDLPISESGVSSDRDRCG
jgi:hypothetical protein